MNRRRFQDVVGLALMGDAVKHLVGVREHHRLWETGTADSRYRRSLEYLAGHPVLMGLISAGEFALGLWIANRAEAA